MVLDKLSSFLRSKNGAPTKNNQSAHFGASTFDQPGALGNDCKFETMEHQLAKNFCPYNLQTQLM